VSVFETVTTSHGQISYLDVGIGPATVFVLGVVINSVLWRQIMVDASGHGRRCIALDLPGHGRTPVPEHMDISLAGLAALIVGFFLR
jgi:pimeloyl-ACP methyl ester carboxylesterase